MESIVVVGLYRPFLWQQLIISGNVFVFGAMQIKLMKDIKMKIGYGMYYS